MIGVAVLSLVLTAGGWLLVTTARGHGILLPVVVGLVLRIVVMAVIHVVAVTDGGGGILYEDDGAYFLEAEALATQWRAGQLVNPSTYEYAGSYQFGYSLLCSLVFALTGPSVLAAKLLNVLLSAAAVLLTALLAGRVLGVRMQRPVAWIAALAPTMVWWSVPMLKEALAAVLFIACLLLVIELNSVRRILALLPLLLALATVRAGAAAVVVAAGMVGYAVASFQARRTVRPARVALVAGGGLAVAGAALMLLSVGRPDTLLDAYGGAVDTMVAQYQGSNALLIPVDVARSLAAPYPWAFDARARSWDQGLYPGMWVLFGLYPLAAWGIWKQRRRPEIVMAAAGILLFLLLNSATSGFVFRQRSTIEPLVIVLAAASGVSLRTALRVAAASFCVAAVAAALQSRAPVAPAAILAAAGLLAFASRWAPAGPPRLDSGLTPLADTVRRVLGRQAPRGDAPVEVGAA